MAFILWLVLTALSIWVLYLIIKAAINNSDLVSPSSEVRQLSSELHKQHKEILQQLEQINRTLAERNEK